MKVLITGGLGYIGSHIAIRLLENNYDVSIIDNLSNSSIDQIDALKTITGKNFKFDKVDIRDKLSLQNFFKKKQFDVLIHAAGLKSISESIKFPDLYNEVNYEGTKNLLSCIEKCNINKIIFSSSASVYGLPNFLPINENHILDASNPYSISKKNIELLLRNYSILNKSDIFILRYFNPVGYHKSGLIAENINSKSENLVNELIKSILSKSTFFINGNNYDTNDGSCERDFIHIDDLVNAHVYFINESFSPNNKINNENVKIYNVGTGKPISVLNFVETFCEVNNLNPKIEYKSRRDGDLPVIFADNSKIIKETSWTPSRNLVEMCKSAWYPYDL